MDLHVEFSDSADVKFQTDILENKRDQNNLAEELLDARKIFDFERQIIFF